MASCQQLLTDLLLESGQGNGHAAAGGAAVDAAPWISQIQQFTVTYIFPAALVAGFTCQLANLLVLRERKIRNMTYTIYLRALSLIYLAVIPLMIASLLRRCGLVPRAVLTSAAAAFFCAHLESYAINVLLFAGNLVVAAITAKAYVAVVRPLTPEPSNGAIVGTLLLLVAATAALLAPVTMITQVKAFGDSEQAATLLNSTLPHKKQLLEAMAHSYCTVPLPNSVYIAKTIQLISAAIFEVFLLFTILGLYIGIFKCFRKNQMSNEASAGKQQMRRNVKKVAKSQKAVAICLGSVAGYLLSNSASALKQTIYLVQLCVSGEQAVADFKSTQLGRLLILAANCTLLLNFTLTVITQYVVSNQYKKQVIRLIGQIRWLLFGWRDQLATRLTMSEKRIEHSGSGTGIRALVTMTRRLSSWHTNFVTTTNLTNQINVDTRVDHTQRDADPLYQLVYKSMGGDRRQSDDAKRICSQLRRRTSSTIYL